MNETGTSLEGVFSKNRAEELGYDVWQHFVVPPFYDRLDLETARKPRLIIGGRGCGKTMLLRYLSHQSMFSPNRPISSDIPHHIGLYWRTDTQFANAMVKRGVPDDVWDSAFSHMAALTLGLEVLNSLRSLAASRFKVLAGNDVASLTFERLKAFSPVLPDTATSLHSYLQEQLWQFERWVNDVRKVSEPEFLPGQRFVFALIAELKRQIPALEPFVFFVYLDEYENLCKYQKVIINTWLKHSEAPLIFNLAMKRNAFDTRETTGSESVSDIHDYRAHDLEDYLLQDEHYEIFLAEILFLQLSQLKVGNLPVAPEDLRDPTKLSRRRDKPYTVRVLAAAQKLLPDVSTEEQAKDIFADKALAQKLRTRIESALRHRGSSLSVERFFRPTVPQASIVSPALLYRARYRPEAIAKEMDLLESGQQNRFTGPTGWIHNNFVGCLLQLYEPHSRACPFYAGFRTFCHLSRGNIRHFLELCHKSISRSARRKLDIERSIAPADQAEAARQASTDFLGEVRSFGRFGNQLHTFVLRLGSLFALAHQRPTQSESEQSHFSIGRGSKPLSDDDLQFLGEATKWSVLFEEKGTKKKEEYRPESVEYVLNPIYAPYFHISYRKKRKLELPSADVICLISGSYDQVSAMLKRYLQAWSVEPAEMSPTLFSHLTD
jgi:hypothetical protein